MSFTKLTGISTSLLDIGIIVVGFVLAAVLLTSASVGGTELNSSLVRVLLFALPVTAAAGIIATRRCLRTRRVRQGLCDKLNQMARYQGLADSALAGLAITDLDGVLIYANKQFCDIHGYKENDLVGRSYLTLSPENRRRQFLQIYLRLSTGEEISPLELEQQRGDGSILPVRVRFTRLHDENGSPRYLAATVLDTSQEKAQESNLRRQEACFRHNPSPVLRLDPSGTIHDLNPAGKGIFGADIIGHSVSDVLPDISADALLTLTNTRTLTVNTSLGKKNYRFAVAANLATESIYLFGHDITELVAAQRNLADQSARSDARLRQVRALGHVSLLVEDTSRDVDEVLQELVETLPSLLGPEGRFAAKVALEGLEYTSSGFRESQASLSATISVDGDTRGILQLVETNESGLDRSGPGLTDAQPLLNPVARSIGRFVERVESLRALEASREESRLILEKARDAFIGIDSGGIVTAWNRQAERSFGYSRDFAIGRGLADLIIPPDLVETYQDAIETDLAAPQLLHSSQRHETRVRHRDGRQFPVEWTTWTIGADGNRRTYSLIHDISERARVEKELRRGQMLLDTTLESTSDGIIIIDSNGRILRCNPKAMQMWNLNPEMIEAEDPRPFLNCVLDNLKYVRRSRVIIERSLTSDQVIEEKVALKDGRTYEVTSYPLRGDSFSGRVWSSRDVTARVISERKLQHQNQFMKQIINSLSDPLFVIDAHDFTIVLANQATGFSSADGPRKCYQRRFGSDQPCRPEQVTCAASETIRTGKPSTATNTFTSVDGDTRVTEVRAHPVFDEAGSVRQVILHEQDTTERVERQQELLMLSAAVDQSAHMMFVLDTTGRLRYVNPAFCRQTGFSSHEVMSRPIRLFEAPDQKTQSIEKLLNRIIGGDSFNGKLLLRRKGGEAFWARLAITAVRTSGKMSEVRLLAVGEDISQELMAQQQLAESDKMSAIGTLAAGVAHEFKNFLAGIMANASFALEEWEADDADEIARDALIQILQLSENANEIAMSLLSYSRAKAEDRFAASLKEIIVQTVRLIEKEFRTHQIEVVMRLDELPPVIVSPSKLQQLMLNLLINAAQAIGDDGVVTITLSQRNDRVILRVADSGKGISPANLKRIFDPFFSTKGVWGEDSAMGTGIGLSICRNIALEHGGDLTVESVVGVGTTFTLSIPFRAELDSDSARRSASRKPGMILVTSDQHIARHYRAQGEITETPIDVCKTIEQIDEEIAGSAQLLACDQRTVKEPDTFRLQELCRKIGLTCNMINCGYRNDTQQESSTDVVFFEGLPDIEILARSRNRSRKGS